MVAPSPGSSKLTLYAVKQIQLDSILQNARTDHSSASRAVLNLHDKISTKRLLIGHGAKSQKQFNTRRDKWLDKNGDKCDVDADTTDVWEDIDLQ